MRKPRGFTLIELLVVIGVIAVLAAILAPAYTEAERASQRTVCQSNLAQIGKAFSAYNSDYNGCYPCVADDPSTDKDESDPCLWMGRHWRWPISKYIAFGAHYDKSNPAGANQVTRRTNTVLACPADPTSAEQYDKTSYGYSFTFYHTPEQMSRLSRGNTLMQSEPDKSLRPHIVNTSMVRYPSKKALIAEWLTAHSDIKANWWSWGGNRYYLFTDGHVRYLGAKIIHSSIDGFPDINLTTHGVFGKDID